MSDIDSTSVELRLIVARAFAMEHGVPLGFHEEEDQLDFDRKAQATLRDITHALTKDANQ